jgi:hypothetical protein
MAIKPGAKIVAHTRLAVTDEKGVITLFVPGDVITVGAVVSAEQADAWITAGSAALAPTGE